MKQKKEQELVRHNGGVTSEQIAMWKSKYRKISEITVVDDEEEHVGYFRRPDMKTMAAVNTLGKTDEVKAASSLFDNCWLGGSTVIQEDAMVKMTAIGQINQLMAVNSASIKNL